jgi:glycosyltransferase involved in cell wall biosynthesis
LPESLIYLWDADYPWDVRTEKVCASLTRAGYDMHIVARNRGWLETYEMSPIGAIHRMKPWSWLGKRLDNVLGFPAFLNPRWAYHLGSTAATAQARGIIIRDLPLCPLAIWAGRRLRIPVILDMAENYPALLQDVWNTGRQGRFDWLVRNPRAAEKVERYCLPRVDRIVVVVEESKSRLERLGVESWKIDIVSNTPPRSRVSKPRQITNGQSGMPLTLVYMGLMEVARGLEVLLDGMALLAQKGADAKLDLIGGGRDLDLLRRRAARLGLWEPRVTFHGYVPHHGQALEIVAKADVGVIPHLANGWANSTIPNKLFDYMAAGLPVLTSDAAPCARIVRQTGAGEIFRSGDPQELARGVGRLRPPDVRSRYSQAGRSAILDTYNWEADTKRLCASVAAALSNAEKTGQRIATP